MCYHTHFLGHPIFFMIEFRMLKTPKQLISILYLYYEKTGRYFSAERLWEQRTMFFQYYTHVSLWAPLGPAFIILRKPYRIKASGPRC